MPRLVRLTLYGTLVAFCLVHIATAQSGSMGSDTESAGPAETSREDSSTNNSEAVRLDRLPRPLQTVEGNIQALEKDGYFKVDRVDFTVDRSGNQNVRWTVLVQKPITCRHIETYLSNFSDVRIYKTLETGALQELYAGLLDYSDRVKQGSANGRLLRRDDQFNVWLSLSPREVNRLINRGADTITFSRFSP